MWMRPIKMCTNNVQRVWPQTLEKWAHSHHTSRKYVCHKPIVSIGFFGHSLNCMSDLDGTGTVIKLELYSPNSSGESSKRDSILAISPKGGTHHAIERATKSYPKKKIHALIQIISNNLTNFNQHPISNSQNTSDILKVLSTSTEASTLIPLRCHDLQSSNSAGPTLI